jgi:hypothetical protein
MCAICLAGMWHFYDLVLDVTYHHTILVKVILIWFLEIFFFHIISTVLLLISLVLLSCQRKATIHMLGHFCHPYKQFSFTTFFFVSLSFAYASEGNSLDFST